MTVKRPPPHTSDSNHLHNHANRARKSWRSDVLINLPGWESHKWSRSIRSPVRTSVRRAVGSSHHRHVTSPSVKPYERVKSSKNKENEKNEKKRTRGLQGSGPALQASQEFILPSEVKNSEVRYTFIQFAKKKKTRPKPFRPNRLTISSNDTFVQKRFHPNFPLPPEP